MTNTEISQSTQNVLDYLASFDPWKNYQPKEGK